jgi:hypothetical protein
MFSNKEALERLEQAHGAKIEKMFWIAGSLENSDLIDLIEEMDDKAFKKCFPTLADCPYLEEYRNDDEILQALVDKDLFGLVAEILIPIAKDFSYDKDGKVSSWSSSGGHCRVDYVYAETLDLLLSEIEKSGEKHFKKFLKEDKKKLSKLAGS